MTKGKQNYQVIIVGGGPAGIATALTLSAKGISNCIIEATTTPRRKAGEAIPPNAKPLLRQLGLMPLVEDPKHLVYYGNKICWGADVLQQKEFIQEVHGHGYLLDRLYFETQLRTHLKNHGGDFWTGYKLKKVLHTANGVEVRVENENATATIQGDYIVDATGRKASVCRQLGIPKKEIDRQFALTFNLQFHLPIERQILVEATKNGWWYAAPQGANELTIMFFTLKELLPTKKETHTFLQQTLKNTLHLSKIINPKNLLAENIKIMPTGTSCLDIPYGKNWIAVGDAAYSYDPISSYGITSALASGYYAGQALASHFSGKEEAMPVYRYIVENAFQAYLEKLTQHYSLENRWKGSVYWENRLNR